MLVYSNSNSTSPFLPWRLGVVAFIFSLTASLAFAAHPVAETVAREHPGLIPAEALDRAFNYFEEHADKVANKNYITIIDFTRPSTEKRCHIIDLKTGQVESLLVSHGRETGGNRAEHFSNRSGSNMSSLGIYLCAELYQGKHGLSMRLDGMESTNDNVRKRAIVMHGADYVSQSTIQKAGRLGRSLGCPALSMDVIERVVKQLNGKSVMMIYGKESASATTKRSDTAGPTPGIDE